MSETKRAKEEAECNEEYPGRVNTSKANDTQKKKKKKKIK